MASLIELPREIDEALAADIEKESVYVSPHLGRLRVTPERTAVELQIAGGANDAEVRDKVARFLDAMLRRTQRFDTKVYLDNARRDAGPYAAGVNEELRRRKWVHDYGSGQVALSGPVLVLSNAIDRLAAELYARHFGALTGAFPALVDADLLARCGYFDSHPNNASFVGHLIEDFDTIEQFRRANSNGRVEPPHQEHVLLPGLCLNPAACFPCYPTLSGEVVGSAGRVYTWQGRVFRYESRNLSGLDRLWEFNVRELVFVGAEEFVAASRQAALPVIGEIARTFDLDCRVETATDPFFATVAAAKTFWQQAQEVKNEILLPLEQGRGGRTIAGGSINIHGNFFGDRFDITTQDGPAAFTGCIGLGIERWVLAAFTQHGFEPERWPEAVAKEIFR